jgi:hypothetical protein
MAGSKKKLKPAYMTVRKSWTRNPVTRVKQDEKKVAAKKICRKKVGGETDTPNERV